jgi:hypothetical protein
MEQETITPGRGSPESAAWFRDKLAALGMGQSALARLMLERGDDRQMATILRSLSRMASGDARVSGEMRALLGVLEEMGRNAHQTNASEVAAA